MYNYYILIKEVCMNKNTTIVVDERVLKAVKSLLATEGRSFSRFVRDAMLDYLISHRTPAIDTAALQAAIEEVR
jgi:hypothetical protein